MSDRIVTAPISKIVEAIVTAFENQYGQKMHGITKILFTEALQSLPTQDININAKDYGYGASETRSGKAFERGYRLGFTANSPTQEDSDISTIAYLKGVEDGKALRPTQDEREVLKAELMKYELTAEDGTYPFCGSDHDYIKATENRIDRYLAQRGGGEAKISSVTFVSKQLCQNCGEPVVKTEMK